MPPNLPLHFGAYRLEGPQGPLWHHAELVAVPPPRPWPCSCVLMPRVRGGCLSCLLCTRTCALSPPEALL
jgi:hypothetical protein